MKLINNNRINFGLYDSPLDEINPNEIGQKSFLNFFPFNFSNRLNQFHFTGICGTDFYIAVAVIDLKLITKAFCYVFQRSKNKVYCVSTLNLPSKKRRYIGLSPENEDTVFNSKKIKIKISSEYIDLFSSSIELKIRFRRAPEPLRLCTRTGPKGWTFTKKELPINIESGFLRIDGRAHQISSPDYYMISDWTMGKMRRETYWNWASSAGRLSKGQLFGLNLSCGVNETSFTENAFWIDGKRTKVDLVSFEYDNPEKQWIIRSMDKKIDLVFIPENNYQEKVNAIVFASCFNQLAGNFSGELFDDAGDKIIIESCPGWAEDHYAKW